MMAIGQCRGCKQERESHSAFDDVMLCAECLRRVKTVKFTIWNLKEHGQLDEQLEAMLRGEVVDLPVEGTTPFFCKGCSRETWHSYLDVAANVVREQDSPVDDVVAVLWQCNTCETYLIDLVPATDAIPGAGTLPARPPREGEAQVGIGCTHKMRAGRESRDSHNQAYQRQGTPAFSARSSPVYPGHFRQPGHTGERIVCA